jgi:hypothetical protein
MPRGKAVNPCAGSCLTVEIDDIDSIDDKDGRLMVPCPICARALYPRSQSSTSDLTGTKFYAILPTHNERKRDAA